MIEYLIALDRESFLFLNGLHSDWLDPIMLTISQTITWIPLYLVMLYFLLKEFKNESWAPLLGILITILIADQTNTAVLKPLFERLRPSRDPLLEGLVHIVNGYKGGLYGFASSHASNTFGVAVFLTMVLKKNQWLIAMLFLWAITVSYSRIYLGVHYPGDVIGGAIIGVISALIGIRCYLFAVRFYKQRQSASNSK